MFGRRRRRGDTDPLEQVEDLPGEVADAAVDEPQVPARPQGPWDLDDVPEDDVPRLDLGGLQVPVLDGVELRVDLDEQQQVVAATFVRGEDVMQVGAFAAPRTEGIWPEVCAEIADTLREQGGSATEAQGHYGTELRGRIPAGSPGLFTPARFVGVDGPRWFLRALHTGPAAGSGSEEPLLAATFRDLVVVRGRDAMAPRDPIPLRLPREALEHDGGDAEGGQPGAEPGAAPEQTGLQPPERGPEITETR